MPVFSEKRRNRVGSLVVFYRATLLPLSVTAIVILGACTDRSEQVRADRSSTTPSAETATSPPSAVAPTSSTPQVSGAVPCQSSSVAISYLRSNGATGETREDFTVTNVTATACSMEGYVKVQLYDAQGRALRTETRPISNEAPRRVVIGPKGVGSFSLGYRTIASDDSQCPAAADLDITLPGSHTPVRVSVKSGKAFFAPCKGLLFVSPLRDYVPAPK